LDSLKKDSIYENFKFNLIRYYGVSEAFAQQVIINFISYRFVTFVNCLQFKDNLKRAVDDELQSKLGLANPRQNPFFPDDEEDEEEITEAPTVGASPFNIVNGIYGILQGVGTLNPDRVFASTVNFFPPSQKQQAQALINSALGMNPGTWPTTTPTTTKLTTSTKDPDEDYDEDEDKTTHKGGLVTPAAAASLAITVAPSVSAVSGAVTTVPVVASLTPLPAAAVLPIAVTPAAAPPLPPPSG
jgi:hypothetical protein